jgi:N-acetylornithine carbamoyltransferase
MEGSLWHPCQALADALTLTEVFNGAPKNKTFTLTWAPHPKQLPLAVPHSTALIAAQLGMNLRIACPEGYEFDSSIMGQIEQAAALSGGMVSVFHEQEPALEGADVVYAKSWTPPSFIGRKELELEHRKSLLPWLVDEQLMQKGGDPFFMHCLPVRRNIEVADEVLDSKKSLTDQQAANRLHAQNALLLHILSSGAAA